VIDFINKINIIYIYIYNIIFYNIHLFARIKQSTCQSFDDTNDDIHCQSFDVVIVIFILYNNKIYIYLYIYILYYIYTFFKP